MKIIDIQKPFLKPGQRFCYWIPASGFVPGQGMRVSIVKEGETGHFPTGEWPCPPGGKMPWFWGNKTNSEVALLEAELCCADFNAKKGLSEEDVQAILISTVVKQA